MDTLTKPYMLLKTSLRADRVGLDRSARLTRQSSTGTISDWTPILQSVYV